MDKIFKGESIEYNITNFKEQLNEKSVYLTNYEIDNIFEFLNIVENNSLNIVQLNPKPVESKKNFVYLRGECDTQVAKDSYDKIMDIAKAIKVNLNLAEYEFNITDTEPTDLKSMKEYIDNNIILIEYPVPEDNSNFRSFYLSDKFLPKPIIFINSNEYEDNKNFYLAHELYHHFYKDKNEVEADNYAAKLLILDKDLELYDKDDELASIVKIQKRTGVAYRSIVKALYNREYINDDTNARLMKVNPRAKTGKYYSLIEDVYQQLNRKEKNKFVSGFIQKILEENCKNGKITESVYSDYLDLLYGK